jgi:hypothetical protein
MDGMAKIKVRIDSVAITPSFSFLGDVAGFQQVRDYLPRCPFCDANSIGQVQGSYPGVVSDITQHQGMIGKKCPLRHVLPPFKKILLNFAPKVLTNNALGVQLYMNIKSLF